MRVALVVSTLLAAQTAYAEEYSPMILEVPLLILQPRLSYDAMEQYARAITKASKPHGLEPLLIASIVRRESSFSARVAECRRLGPAREEGLMQIMPRGVARRFAIDGCRDACNPRCSLKMGTGFLAFLRDTPEKLGGCPGSTWRWVAGYGRRRCPTEARARKCAEVIHARDFYLSAGGKNWPE